MEEYRNFIYIDQNTDNSIFMILFIIVYTQLEYIYYKACLTYNTLLATLQSINFTIQTKNTTCHKITQLTNRYLLQKE